jgi:hypothetical protein
MGIEIELVRQHSRAPVHAVTVAWWRKSGDEFRAAMQERNRSKVGRLSRLRGQAETTEVPGTPNDSMQEKIAATVKAMREAGAPEADIEAFIAEQAA